MLVGSYPPSHPTLYIAKAALCQVRLERGKRCDCHHVRHQPHVNLRDGAAGKEGLVARPRVTANEPFDVDRGPRHQQFQRLTPARIIHPVLDGKRLLGRPPRRGVTLVVMLSYRIITPSINSR